MCTTLNVREPTEASLPAWYDGCSGVILVAELCQLSGQNCTKDLDLKREKSGFPVFSIFYSVHIDTYWHLDTYWHIDTNWDIEHTGILIHTGILMATG